MIRGEDFYFTEKQLNIVIDEQELIKNDLDTWRDMNYNIGDYFIGRGLGI